MVKVEKKLDQIDKLLGEGKALCKEKKYFESIMPFERALKICRKKGSRRELASLYNIAFAYCEIGNYEKAKEYYEAALDIARKFGDKERTMIVLNYLADVLRSLKQHFESIDKWKAAIKIALEIGNKEKVVSYIKNVKVTCNYLTNLGEHDKAIENLKYALFIAQMIGDIHIQCNLLDCLMDLAKILCKYNRYSDCIKLFEYTLRMCQKNGFQTGELAGLHNLGVIHNEIENYEKAKEYYEAALDIARKIGDRKKEMIVLSYIADVLRSLKQFNESIDKWKTAIKIALEIGNNEKVALYIRNIKAICNCFTNLGEHDKAIENLKYALFIAEKIDNIEILCSLLDCLIEKAKVLYKDNRHSDCIKLFELVIQTSRKKGLQKRELSNLCDVAVAQCKVTNYEKAKEYYEAALDFGGKIGKKNDDMIVLRDLADILSILDEHDHIIESLENEKETF